MLFNRLNFEIRLTRGNFWIIILFVRQLKVLCHRPIYRSVDGEIKKVECGCRCFLSKEDRIMICFSCEHSVEFHEGISAKEVWECQEA